MVGSLARTMMTRHDTSLRRASAGDNWVECGAAGVCCRMVAMGIHFPLTPSQCLRNPIISMFSLSNDGLGEME
jgi:hypothetical protein